MMEYRLHPGCANAQGCLANGGGHGFEGCTAGDDDGGQGHQGQHQATHQRDRAGQPKKVDEDGQPQQTKDDGGHRRQVVDVDLDKVGKTVDRGKLLQIDRCCHADGERERQGDQQGKNGPHHRPVDACQFWLAGVTGGKEGGVETLLDPALALQPLQPGDLEILHAPLGLWLVAVDVPLDQHIHIIIRRQPDASRAADQIRVAHHHLTQPEGSATADQSIELASLFTLFDLGEDPPQGTLNQAAVVSG